MLTKNGYKILVVDDEPDIVEILAYNLNKEGYDVRTADNGKRAIEIAREHRPHLILLDIMLPHMDGVETCRQLREFSFLKETFIMFLTARSEEYSEVAAFSVGADDFVTKPIKVRALLTRIATVLKRSVAASSLPLNIVHKDKPRINFGSLIIDRESYTVTNHSKPVLLPKKEFELLNFLASNPNKVYTRDELLKHIWGTDVYVLARTVDVHVRKVREKIGGDFIQTVKGVGYKFDYHHETSPDDTETPAHPENS